MLSNATAVGTKLVAAKGDPWELFDLGANLSETVDLASAQPERIQWMVYWLRDFPGLRG